MRVEPIRATPTLALALLLAGSAPAPAQDQEGGEKRLWPETGETRHGRLEVRRGQAVPPEEMGLFDFETLQRIESQWQRLMAKRNREIPPLKYVLPLSPAAVLPRGPATDLGLVERAPDDFIFLENTVPSAAVPGGFTPVVAEPTAVAVGDYVFYTGNWYAASSTDGGDTFSFVNPFTGPYPPPASGAFCCDQVTVYEPDYDAVFYLQQYAASATTGVQRINVDLGADGTFDCFYDTTAQIFGFGPSNFLDYPDLAVSDGYLYHSSNVFSTVGAGFTGAFVVRYPLASVGTCVGTPFDVYMDLSGFFSFKLTRGATDTMYFADHISNASMRIWRWLDAGASPTAFDRALTAWSDAARVCPGPDARDWCGFIDRRLMGAYVGDGVVGFLWVPAQAGGHAFPYTRVARFSAAVLTLIDEPEVWSASVAWAYPSVAVNRNGDLGGTILFGGGATLYTSCATWIADDANGDAIQPLETRVAYFGASGPSVNRSGDYTGAHPYYPNDYLWAGACFGYPSTTVAESHYVLFGREGNVFLFNDGFESGNTSAWSATVP